jgi:hypothetical protein
MSNIQLFTYNLVTQESTDITSTSDDAFFPVENLKHDFSTKVYRSLNGVLSASVIFDFKTIEPIDSLLYQPSFIDGFGFTGSLTFEANATPNFSSPAFTTTLVPNQEFELAFKRLSPAQSYRYWRVTASNAGKYVELSKIFMGKSFSLPNNNIDFGWSYIKDDNSRFKTNRYRQKFIDEIGEQDKIDARFNLLTTDEFQLLNDELDSVGIRKPFWVIIDENEIIIDDLERFAGRFYMRSKPKVINQVFRNYNLRLVIEEAL